MICVEKTPIRQNAKDYVSQIVSAFSREKESKNRS